MKLDRIHRKISLEQAKNRTQNALEYYSVDEQTNTCSRFSDGKSWGGYCVDILIPKTSKTEKTHESTIVDTPTTPVEEPYETSGDCTCSPLITWASDLDEILHFEVVELPAPPTPGPEPPTPESIVYYVLRYKNLMMMYHWLINTFIPSIDFYQKCEVNYKSIKVNDRNKVFDTSVQLFGSLPTTDDFDIGTIIGVTSLYDELVSRFGSFETCQNFLAFMKKLLAEGLFAPLSGTTPYMDVEFALTSNVIDLGFMSPVYENWVEKKKYHLGDIVSYMDDLYILTSCKIGDYDEVEITGEFLKDVLSNKIKDYSVINEETQIPIGAFSATKINYIPHEDYPKINYPKYVREKTINGISRYYLIQPYYKGEYNTTTQVASFDTAPRTHWEPWILDTPLKYIDNTKDKEKYAQITSEMEYTGITESKLISLKRKVASVDDFGEILPFVIKDDNPQNSNGELQYMIGVTNERTSEDGTFRGDALIYVGINPVNSDDGWTDIATIHDEDPTITSDMFNDNGYIKFIYIIGCELYSNKNIIPYTGVKYEEVWKYNKQQMSSVTIEHSSYSFDYISITPIDDNEDTNNLDITNKTPILSKITYYGKEIKDIQYLLSPYIKKEELLGVQNINSLEYDMHSNRYVSAINAYIERGKAGALEKHYILGEIKTFADLENYRNNFFQI